jgi:hypothetical protein
MSFVGMANTCGRLIFGYLSDKQLPFRWGKNTALNRLWMYNILITICGTSTLLSVYATTATTLMLYSIVFGVGLSEF